MNSRDRGAHTATIGILACALITAGSSLQYAGIGSVAIAPIAVSSIASGSALGGTFAADTAIALGGAVGVSASPYSGVMGAERLPASWVRSLCSFLRRVLKRKSGDPRRIAGMSGQMGLAASDVGGFIA